jgi:hypothetical protein
MLMTSTMFWYGEATNLRKEMQTYIEALETYQELTGVYALSTDLIRESFATQADAYSDCSDDLYEMTLSNDKHKKRSSIKNWVIVGSFVAGTVTGIALTK